jgi:nanoRNase/pAp phosphatase (c-di-AMP/oligoRNAs hydrolase)
LAERNGTFGMVVYPDAAGLLQFRVRRCRTFMDFDLRTVLSRLALENGGGHPGAIGFRLPVASVPDPVAFAEELTDKISAMVDG